VVTLRARNRRLFNPLCLMLREATLPLQMCNHLHIIFSKTMKLIFSNCSRYFKPIQIPLGPLITNFLLPLSGILSQSIVIVCGRFWTL
jgi:hypothetical protein